MIVTETRDGLTPQATADGSFTFFSSEFGEHFHSRQGAQQEAIQKYVLPCRLPQLAQTRDHVHLLDVCYGLGYNTAAALTAIWQVNPACHVTVFALESNLQVPRQAMAHHLLQGYPALVQTQLDTAGFTATLLIGDARQTLRQGIPPDWQADAIFLDPFSPPKCPQLWTVEFLQSIGDRLNPQGYLATYCSAAAVRTALQLVGLQIATLADGHPPHPRRRPLGTLASHHPLSLPPLPAWEREHLQTKAAIPYRDPQGCFNAREILQHRQAEQALTEAEPASQWKKRWLHGFPAKAPACASGTTLGPAGK
jgi:tRNA U34 5-methylaminomethyl-2-thiouridine-forming methyltransferase MnmC